MAIIEIPDNLPEAWRDLFSALALLSREQNDPLSPFICSRDELLVCSDPGRYSDEEIAQLDGWGFSIETGNGFVSERYGW
jgi:hypothetical protein